MLQTATIGERLAQYWATKHREHRNVQVSSIQKCHVGASRDTYRILLHYDEDGGAQSRRAILRIMPEGCLASSNISSVRSEYLALQALQQTSMRVPRVFFTEPDEAYLGGSFMLMEEIVGCESSWANIVKPPWVNQREKLGEQFWTQLGDLSKVDIERTGLASCFAVPDATDCAAIALDTWLGELRAAQIQLANGIALPSVEAAIRWLKANPPLPAQRVSPVHGDYRAGNFLYDEMGQVHAILDWEMFHLGDPMEDIGYGTCPVWGKKRPGGMVGREHTIDLWEQSSGLTADAASLRWWNVLALLKLVALHVSAASTYGAGRNTNPQLVVGAWFGLNSVERCLPPILNEIMYA